MDIADRRPEIANIVRTRWGGLLAEIGSTVVEREERRLPPPKELLAATGTSGLQAFSLPETATGEGVDALTWGMVLEQIGCLCADSALPLIMNHQIAIARLVCESGRADLIERYTLPTAQGRCGAGIAYSEEADAFSFNTTLPRKGNGYILAGHESYVTDGQLSDVFLTYVLDDVGDMVALMIERDDLGVWVTPSHPMGMRTTGAASVTFDDVPLPADRILEATDGLTHAQHFLSNQRIWITCAPLSRAQAILEDCASRLSATVRYGEPVAGLKNVETSLGRMFVTVESARAMLYLALARVSSDRTEPFFDPVVSGREEPRCRAGQVRRRTGFGHSWRSRLLREPALGPVYA